MKTMKNFAAQQLSKTQMNEIKGGNGGFNDCGTLYKATMNGKTNYVCSNNGLEMQAYLSIGAKLEPVNEMATRDTSSKGEAGEIIIGFEL